MRIVSLFCLLCLLILSRSELFEQVQSLDADTSALDINDDSSILVSGGFDGFTIFYNNGSHFRVLQSQEPT